MKYELFSKLNGTVRCFLIALLMSAPLEVVAQNELRADQQSEIVANEGKEVAVRGTVREVSTVGSSMISFLQFEGVKFGGFSAVMKKAESKDLPLLVAGADESPMDLSKRLADTIAPLLKAQKAKKAK